MQQCTVTLKQTCIHKKLVGKHVYKVCVHKIVRKINGYMDIFVDMYVGHSYIPVHIPQS